MSLHHYDFLSPITGPAGDQLATIEAEHTAATDRLDALRADQRAAKAELEAATTALVAATLDGSDAERKAVTARNKARARVDEPWVERQRGVELQLREIEGRWHAHVHEHAGDLADELHRDAPGHRDAVQRAGAALAAALSDYTAANQQCGNLLRQIPGIDGQAIPRSAVLDDLSSAVQRNDLNELPVPGVSGDQVRQVIGSDELDREQEERDQARIGQGLRSRGTGEHEDPSPGRRAVWH